MLHVNQPRHPVHPTNRPKNHPLRPPLVTIEPMPRSPRWRRALTCAVVTLFALALAPAAFASNVTISGTTLVYTAGAGETNFVTFTDTGANIHVFEGLSGAVLPAPTL